MHLAFYRNKKSGLLKTVHEVKEEKMEEVKELTHRYNKNSGNPDTVSVREATEYEELLYNRAEISINDMKNQLDGIEWSAEELARLVRNLKG